MEILIKAGQFLLSLSLLIMLHEFGHFILARRFGVRVEKFYMFFNPYFSLYKRKIGKTEFGIGWLPLGGYVKLGGMIDESLDVEQMAHPPRPDDFRSKPAYQRLLIMLGGVLMNLVLAWIIYSGVLWLYGRDYLATQDVTYGIACEPLGRDLGFENGDKILAVNGEYLEEFSDVYTALMLVPDSRVTVQRDSVRVDVEIPRHSLSRMVQGEPLFTLRLPMVVYSVEEGSAAAVAGFQAGDSLVSLDGESIVYFDEFRDYVRSHADSVITVEVSRAGTMQTLSTLVPKNGVVGVHVDGRLSRYYPLRSYRYNGLEACESGAILGWRTLKKYVQSLGLLFVPEAKAYRSLGGVIAIGNIFPGVWDWQSFWMLTAFLSLILAVMNLLPIPGLDGGHVMFLLYEMITRRKPSQQFMIRSQMVGMILLLLLVLFANANDIIRLFR